MHLQNFEKLQSQKIAPRCRGILGQEKAPSFRHHRPYIRLRRNFPRPSPGEPAPRSSGGETEPTPLRGASRLGRMGDYPSQQKRHADGVPFLLAGMAGFEPTTARVKVWCLTAWRHPIIFVPKYYTTVWPVCQQFLLCLGNFCVAVGRGVIFSSHCCAIFSKALAFFCRIWYNENTIKTKRRISS